MILLAPKGTLLVSKSPRESIRAAAVNWDTKIVDIA